MRKLCIVTLTLLACLMGCGESSGSKTVATDPVIEEPVIIPPSPINSVSLSGHTGKVETNRVQLAGQAVTSRAVVNDSFANATGKIISAVGSANVLGNLTLGVKAVDPEGIKSIGLHLPNSNRSFSLCTNNCTEDSLITVTGFDPQLAGEQAGNLRIELIVSDLLDNQTVADTININWQPLAISTISAVRENGTISLNWSGNPSIQRFNIYAATDLALTRDNALSLDNGTQILAFSGSSTQIDDMDEDKPYYILITGINSGGESGSSSPVLIPSNNIPVNLPPVAIADQYQLAEDESFSANVLENDSDPENSAITIHSVTSQPNHGSLDLQQSGNFTYIANANFYGEDSFSYVIVDDLGQESEALVTLTITSVNDDPIARNDVYSLSDNRDIIVSNPGILANDSDIDGDSLVVLSTLISPPQFGSLNLNNDGSFIYVADNNFVLSDNFVYQVDDGNGGKHSAIVTLLASDELLPPEAKNDTYQTNEDIPLIVNSFNNGILANDSDPNGFDITLDSVLLTQPAHGQLNLSLDGTFTYLPDSNYVGNDQFQYQITSTALKTAQATVTITVLAQPDAPNAGDDNYQLIEDQTLVVDVSDGLLKNDVDPDGGTITVNTTVIVAPSKGNVSLNSDGSFQYFPRVNFNGVDSFTYQIVNNNNLTSQATVTLTITASADTPIATNDFANTIQDVAVTIDALANDINIDGGNLTIKSAVADTGSVTVVNNKLLYQPETGYSGIANIDYHIENSAGLTDSGIVLVTITNIVNPNNVPSPNEDYYSVNEDTILNANSVLINDNDADNDPLTVQTTPVTNVVNGSLTLATDGTFVYIPLSNFNGTDSFVYSVTDGQGGFAQETVTIYVNPINDQPVALDDNFSVVENGTFNGLNVLSNDYDPDNNSLFISTTPVSDVTNGNLILKSDGSFIYTPTLTFNGFDSFIYEVNDGKGGTAQGRVSITINSTNVAPIATNDSYIVDENGSIQASTVLANDLDPDNDNLTVLKTPVIDVTNGVLNLKEDGTFIYTPKANYDGLDSFVYMVSDPEGATAQATVSLTIKNKIIPPKAFNDSFIVFSLGGTFTGNVLDNDFLPEGAYIKVNKTPIVDVKHGVLKKLNPNGNFEYTPRSGLLGTDSFTYEIYDEDNPSAGTSQATVTLVLVGLSL